MILYSILLIAAVAFAALAYCRPLYAACFIAAFLPTYLIRYDLFGVPMTWLETMILVLAIVMLALKKIDFKKLRDDAFFWPIIAVLTAATIAVFVSADRLHALGAWKAYFLEPIVYYWLLLSIISARRQLEGLFWALGASVLFLALSGLLQKIFVVGVPKAFLTASGSVDRIVSFYGYPNALGLYLGPIVVLFMGFLCYQNSDPLMALISRTQRFWIKLLIVVSGFWAIVVAQSEGAILAVCATGWLILAAKKKWRWSALIILVLSVIVMIADVGLRQEILSKILLQDWSGMVRTKIWGETWQMLQGNWLFGAGLAGYPLAIVPFHVNKWMEIFPYPHTILFNFWSETGLPGVAAFLWLAGVFAWTNWRNIFASGWRQSQELPFDKLASFVFLMVGLELIIHGLVDVPYFKNDLSVLFWMLIGASSLNISLKK